MTQTLVDLIVSAVWLFCVIVCFLKWKMWTAIFGIIAPVLSNIPIGGMYLHHIITEPFIYVGLPAAAIRLAKPVSWWAKWFYWGPMGSDRQLLRPSPKLARALARFPEQTVDFAKPDKFAGSSERQQTVATDTPTPSPFPQPVHAESTVDPPSISRPPAVTPVKQEQTPKAYALREPRPLPVPASPPRPPPPQPPLLPIVQKNYWVARNGVEIGEFKPFDFMESVDSGKIRQDDWFWMEGMSEWKPVSELKILERLHPPPRPPNTATWPRAVLWIALVLCVMTILLIIVMNQSGEERLHRLSTERKENGVVTNRASLDVAPDDLKKITLFDLEDRNRGVFGRVRNDLSRPVERIGLQASFYTAGQPVVVRRFWMLGADLRSLPPLLPNSPVYFYNPVEDKPRDCTYQLEVIEAHYVNE